MPKKKSSASPEAIAAHNAVMERIFAITGTRTQVQLAEVLEVRQSSISDAKRRASIPPEWLIKLQRSHKVLPDWILTGLGPKFMEDAAPAAVARVQTKLNDLTCTLDETINGITEALRMARMTADEFAERKSGSMTELAQARETIKNLQGQVRDLSAELASNNFTL